MMRKDSSNSHMDKNSDKNSNLRDSSNIMDMTEGNPTKLLLLFSIPLLIGNLFQQVYNLVDSIVVGRYVGADALAAVGVTSSVTFLFFALCNGIGNGGGIITSQYFGARQDDKVKNAIANSAYLTLAMALIVGILSFILAVPILRLLRTPTEIMADAVLYIRMQCAGIPLVAVYNYSAAMLRALGDSKGPLYFLVVACMLNVYLDLLFVKTFGLGVFGVALATIIAQFIAGLGCLIYAYLKNAYFHMKKNDLKPNREMIIKGISLGLPLSFQFALIAVSSMGLQAVVNSFGAAAVAAFTATNRIEQLLHQPYGSLSVALATYTGQNLGAKRKDRIELGFIKSMVIMAVFSLFMLPVMQLFGGKIVAVFVEDAEIIKLGAVALKITSPFYLALGTINVCRGVLNGLGDGMFALQNGIVEVICRILLPVILTLTVLDIWGIWVASGLVWLISAFFCVLRYIKMRKRIYFD